MNIENLSILGNIISSAIDNYAANADKLEKKDWLHGYLTENLTGKTPDEINRITDSILNTIALQETKKSSMEKAVSDGKSVSKWFADEISSINASLGAKGKAAVECLAALRSAGNGFDTGVEKTPEIDVEIIPSEEWDDGKWSPFKLKDALIAAAQEAGNTALKTIASDAFSKITENGLGVYLKDKDSVIDTLVHGAVSGLKAAVAGALKIADDREIISGGTNENLANIAHKAIEELSVFAKVAKKEMTATEAVASIKNTAVSTVAGILSSGNIKNVWESVTNVFSPVASKIGNVVTAVTASKVSYASSIHNAVKTVAPVAVKVVTTVVSGAGKVFGLAKNLLGR